MVTKALLALLVLGVVLAVPAAASPEARAAATFTDAAGDSGAAPDVTEVAIGNDVVAGPIVFWVTFANRPDDLAGEDVLFILIDADRNAATGDELGAEYWLGVDAQSVGLERWDGTQYVPLDAASLAARSLQGQLRVSVHPDDLGGLTGFDFILLSFTGEAFDAAPNGAPWWSYALASGRPPLFVLDFVLSPKAAAAGRPLIATLALGRGDTLDVLGDEGKVTCTLVVGGKKLKAVRGAVAEGVPFCRWNVPRTAKGKKYTGSIAVTFGGSTAKKTFKGRVR